MWKKKNLLSPDEGFSTVTETVSIQTNKWTFTYTRCTCADINRKQIVFMIAAGRLFPESSRKMLFLFKHRQQLFVSPFHHCIISVRLCKYRYYNILSQSYQFTCNLHVCTNLNIQYHNAQSEFIFALGSDMGVCINVSKNVNVLIFFTLKGVSQKVNFQWPKHCWHVYKRPDCVRVDKKKKKSQIQKSKASDVNIRMFTSEAGSSELLTLLPKWLTLTP